MVVSHSEFLKALIFEKEEAFDKLCNPEPEEAAEGEEPTQPSKPDFQFRDEYGHTPLEKASVLGKVGLIPKLLEVEEVDVNLADPQGYTALHKAAAWGRLEAISCLINNGTDLSLTTCHEETARDLAVRYNHADTVLLLDITLALQSYRACIADIHGQVTDPERIVGKLNKEEKQASNKLCEEALEWTKTAEVQSVEEITEHREAYVESMQPFLSKIAPPPED